VGCEPATFGDPDEVLMELSDAVARSVEPAVEMVEQLIQEFMVDSHA